MAAEVIRFLGANDLGFSHVVCSECSGDRFHIETDDSKGYHQFKWLHCVSCGSQIPVKMTPCFGPRNEIEDDLK
jgi:hypothetical protein